MNRIDVLGALAYTEVTRSIERGGLYLSHVQAQRLDDAAWDWARKRLGLAVVVDDDGVLLAPRRPHRLQADDVPAKGVLVTLMRHTEAIERWVADGRWVCPTTVNGHWYRCGWG